MGLTQYQTSKNSRWYMGKTVLKLQRKKKNRINFCAVRITWIALLVSYSQAQAHSSSDTVQFDRRRKQRVASNLNGRCDWKHKQIECLSDSHIRRMHIHTLTEHISRRPDPTAAAMCLASVTTPFYSQGISQTVPSRSVWVVHVEEVLFLPSYWYGNS